VWNGSEYAAFYRYYIGNKEGVYFSRWSKTGIQLGQPKLAQEFPDPANVAGTYVKTVWNGTGYGVLVSIISPPNSYLQFNLYDAAGDKLTDPVKVAPTSAVDHDIVWTGDEYGVAWSSGTEMYFARVSAAGAVIGPPALIASVGFASGAPSLAWSGFEYGAAFNLYGEVRFTRISSSGFKLIDEVVVEPEKGGPPRIAWAQGQYTIAWADRNTMDSSGYDSIMVRHVSENGVPQGSAAVVAQLNDNTLGRRFGDAIDLAWNGGSFGVTWVSNEVEPKGYEVQFTRLDTALQAIGGEVAVTSFGARDMFNYTDAANLPRLVWNGDEYAVAWQDYLGQPSPTWSRYMRSICY
jgi:hypothetical protein